MRRRITRVYDVINYVSMTPAMLNSYLALPWGEADATYPTCLLIKQDVTGQGEGEGSFYAPNKNPPILTRVFEQIPASAEIQVGNNTAKKLQDGRTAIEAEFLQFSSATPTPGTPGFTTAPGDANAYMMTESAPSDGTLRRITRTYVYAGTIATDLQTLLEGALLIQTITSVKTVPATPSGYTLIGQPIDSPNGLPTYTYKFAKGSGLVEKRIQLRDGGLRLETWISLGNSFDSGTMQPPGILAVKDEENLDGYKRFTVTCTQKADGTDPTSGIVLTYGIKSPWKFPGRAKAYTTDFTAIAPDLSTYTAHARDVFLSPPVEILIDATVQVSYQTSAAIGSLTYPLWNPDTWATVQAFWEGWGATPRSLIQTHNEYRAVGSPVTFTAGATISSGGTVVLSGSNNSCMGERVYGLSTGSITVSGGPSAPDGNTYTLSVQLEPAFQAEDGTQYYRRTVVYATIPTQTALPV